MPPLVDCCVVKYDVMKGLRALWRDDRVDGIDSQSGLCDQTDF
jgi:hypothetical protein